MRSEFSRSASARISGCWRVRLEHARFEQASRDLLHLVHQVDRGACRQDEPACRISLAACGFARLLVFKPADAELETQGLPVKLDALDMIRERLDHLGPVDVLKLNLRLRCLGQL